jgi:hypothetical protein
MADTTMARRVGIFWIGAGIGFFIADTGARGRKLSASPLPGDFKHGKARADND